MGIFNFGVKRGLRKNAKKIAFIAKKLMEQLQAKTGQKLDINKIDFSYEFPGNAIYQFICPETGKLSEDFGGMDVKESITIRTPNVTRLFTAYSLSHSEKSAEKFCALFEKIILDELGDNSLTAKTIGAHCSGTGINDSHWALPHTAYRPYKIVEFC